MPRAFIAQAVYTLSQFSPKWPVIVNGERYTRADFEAETPPILVESPLASSAMPDLCSSHVGAFHPVGAHLASERALELVDLAPQLALT